MSCLYCEKPCKKSKCNKCDVKYHTKCYTQYTKNSHTVCKICVKCPKCKETNRNKDVESTRLYSEHTLIIYTCKRMFERLQPQNLSTESRKYVLAEIFEYLIQHKWFIHQHPSFNKAVIGRLTEYVKNDQWSNASDYYYRIYGKQLIV